MVIGEYTMIWSDCYYLVFPQWIPAGLHSEVGLLLSTHGDGIYYTNIITKNTYSYKIYIDQTIWSEF